MGEQNGRKSKSLSPSQLSANKLRGISEVPVCVLCWSHLLAREGRELPHRGLAHLSGD